MDTVKHQLNLFIIPFVYKMPHHFDEVINQIDSMKENGQHSVWLPIVNNMDDRFFEHINQLVPTDGCSYESTIGRVWKLNTAVRGAYGLPKNENNRVVFHPKKKKNILLKITDVQLFLFETGIGFLVYEIDYPEICSMDDLIQANYLVRRLKNYGGKMYIYKGREDRTDYEISSTLSDITANLLSPLQVTSYFEKEKFTPKYALVFSTAILDETFSNSSNYLERLKRYLFEMRRGFKESYHPNETEYDFHLNPEVYQPFQNSVWGISLEGAGNLVYHTDNKTTNNFFSGSYLKNVKFNYFYMYILALHQRYAILNLSIRAAEIPRNMEELVQSPEEFQSILQLREEIAYFDLRSLFIHVSHITHQSNLYQYIYQTLHIGDLHTKLQSEVESVASLLDIRRTMIEKETATLDAEREEKRQERIKKNDFFYVIMSTLFVAIATLSSLWTIYKDFFKDIAEAHNVFTISFCAIVIMAGIGIWYKLFDKSNKKNMM